MYGSLESIEPPRIRSPRHQVHRTGRKPQDESVSVTGNTKQYKDFEKYDPRRYLVALFAVERLKERATAHYIGLEIGCSRVEVMRALESAQKFYLVEIDKDGPVYAVTSWGVLNKAAALRAIAISS